MSDVAVIHGDMRDVLGKMIAEGKVVQSVVTDPPYGLGFMSRAWDAPANIAFQPGTWRLCFELLPPGGFLIAFGGDRTYHRLATAIEEAGFEIRNAIAYLFGSGFPKGLNVVTQLVKLALWQSKDHALCAAQASASIQVKSEKAKASIAVALARILPAGGLALLTEIGGEVALHVPMDTWPSEWMAHIGLSTTSLSKDSLEDVYSNTSKCITLTASEQTTGPKIYDWLIGIHTSATTTRCSVTLPNGCEWPALTAVSNLNGSSESRKDILIVTALGNAGWNPVARFDGFNVALKPAMELICVARKPLDGTVAANVLKHGTGALNIQGCRVGVERGDDDSNVRKAASHMVCPTCGKPHSCSQASSEPSHAGRTALPPNGSQHAGRQKEPRYSPESCRLCSHCGGELLPLSATDALANVLQRSGADSARAHQTTGGHSRESLSKPSGNYTAPDIEQQGRWPANVCHDGSDEVVSAFPETQSGEPVGTRKADWFAGAKENGTELTGFGDSGSAARFFYSAKADAGDRLGSKHPTVKPVDLMRWLVRLITPPGGTVLDPFAGSGATGMACMAEGFDCILVEREAEYVADIKARIAHVHGEDTPLFSGVML